MNYGVMRDERTLYVLIPVFLLAALHGYEDLTKSGASHNMDTVISVDHRNRPRESLPVELARQSDTFVNSVGVNTHLSYNNTSYYQEWPRVFAALRSSGIRHIRDGYYNWDPSSVFLKEHRALAFAGIHTTYVVPHDAKTTPDAILRFSSMANDFEAIEAPNECDSGHNCGGGGMRGVSNAASFQAVVHAAGELLHVPVLGPSFTSQEAYGQAGDLSRLMTVNNLHIYFGGRNPGSRGWGAGDTEGHQYGSFDWWMDQGRLDGGKLPLWITETGYMMPIISTPYTIPRSLGALYLPRTLLLAFNHGFLRTFMYEFLDEISSPDYGLLTADLQEKPAFNAVRSLLHLLTDPGPAFTPGSLAYEVQGDSTNLEHTLLQKRDRSFWLILWKEVSEHDPVTNTAKFIPAEALTLRLQPGFLITQISTLNNAGTLTNTKYTNPKSICALSINGHPIIVRIAPHVP